MNEQIMQGKYPSLSEAARLYHEATFDLKNVIRSRAALRTLPFVEYNNFRSDIRNITLNNFQANLKKLCATLDSNKIKNLTLVHSYNFDNFEHFSNESHLSKEQKNYEISLLNDIFLLSFYDRKRRIVTNEIKYISNYDFYEIKNDIMLFNNNLSYESILSEPLFSKNINTKLKKKWLFCKEYLNRYPDEHWHVWTDWWEDRRDGKPYNIEMEREIVLIPDEDWQKGPAHVNPMIAEIRAKYRMPRENSRGLPFGARDGAIVLRSGRIPSTDEDAVLFHAALLDDVTRLADRLATCGKNEDPYDILCLSTDALIVALGSDATETKTSKLWLGARKLREIERIDRRTQNEFGRNVPPLETEVGEALRTTLATFTAFCGTVPALQKLEQANRDNAEVTGIPLEAIDPIIAMVRAENDKFHDEVRAAFDGLLADARSTIDGVAERGEAVTLASVENLIHRLVAEAIAEDRKGQSSPFWEAYKKKAGERTADLTLGTLAFSAKALIAYHFADLAGFTDKLPNGENARHMLEQAIKGKLK